jgi:hypothetical protein
MKVACHGQAFSLRRLLAGVSPDIAIGPTPGGSRRQAESLTPAAS